MLIYKHAASFEGKGIAKNFSAEEKAAKSKTPIFNICRKVANRFEEEVALR